MDPKVGVFFCVSVITLILCFCYYSHNLWRLFAIYTNDRRSRCCLNPTPVMRTCTGQRGLPEPALACPSVVVQAAAR